MVALFPVWSVRMGVAKFDILEKTTANERKEFRKFLGIK
jgi:hypothetical protein